MMMILWSWTVLKNGILYMTIYKMNPDWTIRQPQIQKKIVMKVKVKIFSKSRTKSCQPSLLVVVKLEQIFTLRSLLSQSTDANILSAILVYNNTNEMLALKIFVTILSNAMDEHIEQRCKINANKKKQEY